MARNWPDDLWNSSGQFHPGYGWENRIYEVLPVHQYYHRTDAALQPIEERNILTRAEIQNNHIRSLGMGEIHGEARHTLCGLSLARIYRPEKKDAHGQPVRKVLQWFEDDSFLIISEFETGPLYNWVGCPVCLLTMWEDRARHYDKTIKNNPSRFYLGCKTAKFISLRRIYNFIALWLKLENLTLTVKKNPLLDNSNQTLSGLSRSDLKIFQARLLSIWQSSSF